MWKICDVQPVLLLPTVLDLRLLSRKLFMVGPYLLSLLDAGIALQGLITQVATWNFSRNLSARTRERPSGRLIGSLNIDVAQI